MFEVIRIILGSLLIVIGLVTIVLAIFGVYRLNYILNRMHVAATCDTLGLFLMLVGLILIEGFTFNALKLALIIVFFWISSPICSHLISKVESLTNEKVDEECEEVNV